MAIITDSQEDGDGEVAAPSAAKAISRSDEDVFATVLERTGGPLPFLQAAIDVARESSGLFHCDPTAARKVAAMAKAARAKVEAEEKLVAAKEETRKLTERRRNEESRRAADAERKMEGDAENTAKDGRRARGDSSRSATFFGLFVMFMVRMRDLLCALVISDAAFTHQIEGAMFLSTPMSLCKQSKVALQF